MSNLAIQQRVVNDTGRKVFFSRRIVKKSPHDCLQVIECLIPKVRETKTQYGTPPSSRFINSFPHWIHNKRLNILCSLSRYLHFHQLSSEFGEIEDRVLALH